MKKFMIFILAQLIVLISYNNFAFAETTYYNQDVTAYVAASGALTYHGTTPTKYHTIAVHPSTFGNPSSGTIFPYGTIIYVPDGFSLPGYTFPTKHTFKVEDMGDVNNAKGLSKYWFDIYFGTNTTENTNNAVSFGKKTITYIIY